MIRDIQRRHIPRAHRQIGITLAHDLHRLRRPLHAFGIVPARPQGDDMLCQPAAAFQNPPVVRQPAGEDLRKKS